MHKDILEILSEIEKESNSGFFYTPSYYSGTREAKSYYFSNYSEIIIANSVDEIESALERLQEKIDKGLSGFGFIAYEAGYFFEESLQHYTPGGLSVPFLYFILCEEKDIEVINSSEIDFDSAKEILTQSCDGLIDDFTLNVGKNEYVQCINKVKEYIAAGDTYQVNFTIKGQFNLSHSPKELFINSIFNQSSEYSAFINIGGKIIISTSPEMFFEINGDEITTKPMKGTVEKGINLDEEKKNVEFLRSDLKNKAENIMIVDLLRNDIGKICELTSVDVKRTYAIQSYESLHQMVSTVSGKLKTRNIFEILKSIFPCGSITGAPKIRTMQIINELEKEPRGIYTGALGVVSREKSLFNVAIRTAVLDTQTGHGEIGIGSGVVWDSIPEDEFEETKLKAEYLTKKTKYFELIESLLVEKGEPFLLDYHIKRLKNSAEYFLFCFSESEFRNKLLASLQGTDLSKDYKCRVLLDKWGGLKISLGEIQKGNGAGDICISDCRVDSHNKFQYFKTTNRSFYDDELAKANSQGYTDVVFFNEKGDLAEGARTNIIVCKNGNKYTPYLGTGILNGCYRQYLLDRDEITEKKIVIDDIVNADGLILINSVRKTIQIKNVFDSSSKKIAGFTLSSC